ncbi:MAG: MATE family efflux transporter [Parasporobacterium sp.]|nr:MATE family efflux transporter [Parasporobacterium sp.]
METAAITRQNRRKLLAKYLIPTILGNLSVFLFTIVDGIFVGQGAGVDALGAINLVFPFVMFFNAVSMLTTIGGLTICAIRFGRGDKDGANEVFIHSVVMTLAISILFSFLALVFPEPLCRMMGANDTFLEMARDYIFWYGVFMIPCGMLISLHGFVRNDGRPGLASVSTIIATLINVFGDWLFIFPLHMGLKGAAIATGIAQTIELLILLSHFVLKKGVLRFHKRKWRWNLTGRILVRGLPECISQFCVPITTILTNWVLVSMLGDSAVNSYSIICYVSCFSVAIFAGCAEGLQPLFGQCYGSGNETELKFYKRAGIIIGGGGSAVITGIIVALTVPICHLYAADAATMAVTVPALPEYAWGFIMQAFNVVISAYLYSTTRTKQAVIINCLRTFVVNVLVVLLLPRIFPPQIIWFTFGIYEAIVLVIAVILMQTSDKKGVVGRALE